MFIKFRQIMPLAASEAKRVSDPSHEIDVDGYYLQA